MANESTSGGPLTATVGEQLAEKGHLGAAREAERTATATRGGRGQARVPWVALAAAAGAWLLATAITRAIRR